LLQTVAALQAGLYETFVRRNIAVNAFTEPANWKPHVTLAYGVADDFVIPAVGDTVSLPVDNACLILPEMTLSFWSAEHEHEFETEVPDVQHA